MENNNYPSHPPMNSIDKPKKNNTWIYIGIILVLLATNILLFTQKNKTDKQIKQTTEEITQQQVASENLQIQYSAALARLDELVGKNSALDRMIVAKDSEIGKLKNEIESILKNEHQNEADLVKAKGLIQKLNSRINGYEQEIVRLQKENETLLKENQIISKEREQAITKTQELTTERDELTEKVNVGKVLSVSNIQLIPVELRKRKEVSTSKAKRVDILRIVYNINENRLVDDGLQEIYVRILNPEGKLVTNTALGSGTFRINEVELPQYYTMSKKINLKKGEVINDVTMDWQQTADYAKGKYNIELYNNGYMIGKQEAELR